MKKKGYYEYDQPIYPHLLCVGVGLQFEDAKKAFLNNDGTDFEKYDFFNGDGFTYYGLHIRETGRKCVLVLFSSSKAMRMNVICHEASHACDAIEGNIEMKHGGEPSAYLIGWIASCINKARLGIGDFVEIVDKEEK